MEGDIVIAYSTVGLPPDHRYVGVLLQDLPHGPRFPFSLPDVPTAREEPWSPLHERPLKKSP